MLIKTHVLKQKVNKSLFAKFNLLQKMVVKQNLNHKTLPPSEYRPAMFTPAPSEDGAGTGPAGTGVCPKQCCVNKSNTNFKQHVTNCVIGAATPAAAATHTLTLTFTSVLIKDVIKAHDLVTKMLTHLSRWLNKQTNKSLNINKQQLTKLTFNCSSIKNDHFFEKSAFAIQKSQKTHKFKKISWHTPVGTPNNVLLMHHKLIFLKKQKQVKQQYVFACFAKQHFTKNKFKNVQKTVQNTHLFTVIRAAFVFKKTREQFAFNKKMLILTISLQNKAMQNLVILILSALKLPSEVKISCFA